MVATTEPPWSVDENEADPAVRSMSACFNRLGVVPKTLGEDLNTTAAMHGVIKALHGQDGQTVLHIAVRIWHRYRP